MSSTSVPRLGRRRLGALAATAMFLVTACGGGATPSAGPVTITSLFMKQASYSEDNVTEMTKLFEAANPNIKVNLEFVAYDALHDKIVTDQAGGAGTYDTVLLDAIWPAEFAKAKLVRDITDKIPAEKSAKIDGISLAPTLLGKHQPARPFLYRESPGYGGQQSVPCHGSVRLPSFRIVPGDS